MINEETIRKIVEAKVAETPYFIVDVSVSTGNKILIEIDGDVGLAIDKCVEISREVEQSLDREKEDFELSVTSPGLDKPFKVPRQYNKNVGRKVEVTTKEGNQVIGRLENATQESIEILTIEKAKINGKKNITEKQITLKYNEIKQTKIVIAFK